MTKRKQDFAAKLRAAKLPEDTVDICLRGDLLARYGTLHQQLAAISVPLPGAGSLAGYARKAELEQQIDAVREQMLDATQTFTLRSLSDRAYSDFLAEHQPRAEDLADMRVGYNRETMGPALLRACLVDPQPTDEQWEEMRNVISPGEWSKLDKAARDLNFVTVNIPFLSAASTNPSSASE